MQRLTLGVWASIYYSVDLVLDSISSLIHDETPLSEEERIFHPLQIVIASFESGCRKPVMISVLRGLSIGGVLQHPSRLTINVYEAFVMDMQALTTIRTRL